MRYEIGISRELGAIQGGSGKPTQSVSTCMRISRLLKTFMLTAVAFLVPLIGRPELMLHPQVLFLFVGGLVLLLSQPDFSAAEARARSATDRNSLSAILVAGLLSQVIPVIEWAYLGNGFYGKVTWWVTTLGAAMIVGGLSFRIWSILYLGRYFTATVQIVDDHRLITSGPYAIVRHPSYLGAYVALVGGAIFLNTIIGTVVAIVLMAAAYRLRIRVEEEVLGKIFGYEYRDYKSSVPCIFPMGSLGLVARIGSVMTIAALMIAVTCLLVKAVALSVPAVDYESIRIMGEGLTW